MPQRCDAPMLHRTQDHDYTTPLRAAWKGQSAASSICSMYISSGPESSHSGVHAATAEGWSYITRPALSAGPGQGPGCRRQGGSLQRPPSQPPGPERLDLCWRLLFCNFSQFLRVWMFDPQAHSLLVCMPLAVMEAVFPAARCGGDHADCLPRVRLRSVPRSWGRAEGTAACCTPSP